MKDDFLRKSMSKLLEGLSPPKAIAGNAGAMQREIQALLRALLSAAPSKGYDKSWCQTWWTDFEDALRLQMKTRTWPSAYEIRAAIKSMPSYSDPNGADESSVVQVMAEWHRKFGTQMPSMGRPSRTQALLDKGVLVDLAEARRCGYDLLPEEAKAARDMQNEKGA